jgi:alpha-beta hydrolase superfamily lysophospholipase
MHKEPLATAKMNFALSDVQTDKLSALITPPEGWEEKIYARRGGSRHINVAFRHAANPKGLIFVVQGRAQYCREWIEFSDHMIDEGYSFATYDPQGQGLSFTHLSDRRHHIYSYGEEVQDLEFVIKKIREDRRFEGIPWVAVGHSKGGNTLLRYLDQTIDHPRQPFNAMAQISPATGIVYPNRFLEMINRPLVTSVTLLGLDQRYVLNITGPHSLPRYKMHIDAITSDPVAQAVQYTLFEQNPETICHGATWGFVRELLKSSRQLQQGGVAESITLPSFWILGENEQINDNQSMIDFHDRMPNSELRVYDGAQHQIHMETPKIKDRMYDDLKRFLRKQL